MKYAYPQNPTNSITAIKRLDESSDSSTSQSNLERPQDIAVVGETVPLIFCNRHDWGGNYGENGGIWLSPRLIQLGVRQTDLSMMYLLSQGEVSPVSANKTYWGYNKLNDVDSNAQVCTAYEDVPACLDLDYDPGGSIDWTEVINRPGASPNQSGFTHTTQSNKTVKVTLNFSIDCQVTFSGDIVCGGDWTYSCTQRTTEVKGSACSKSSVCFPGYDCRSCTYRISQDYSGKGLNISITNTEFRAYCSNYEMDTEEGGRERLDTYLVTTAGLNRRATVFFTSGVLYDWRVVSDTDGTVVQQGQQWLNHGNNTFEVDGLPPDKYQIQFTSQRVGWTGASSWCITSPNPNMVATVNAYNNSNQGYSNNAPGNGSLSGSSQATEVVYNTLDFPDVPGGDQQIVGGLSDLTMFGIRGDITILRPDDGPDYFLQSHLFVEQGVRVENLLTGAIGPSHFYPDLVLYLMNKTQVLQADQIDKESLRLACQLTQTYKLFFNGVLQTTNSFAEWMTRTAPYFLLTPRQVDGKYGLWPVCPMNAAGELSRDPVVPVMTVTTDDIVAGSYERTYISNYDRRPVCLVMVYRDQPVDSVGQTVTVEVRYPGTALSGPFESHDCSEFACRSEQVIYAARYILAKRRYTTHVIDFTMARRGAQLRPGDIIELQVGLPGSTAALTTSDNEAGVGDTYLYQIDLIEEAQGGTVAISATHFPIDSNGVSVIAKETHSGQVSVQ